MLTGMAKLPDKGKKIVYLGLLVIEVFCKPDNSIRDVTRKKDQTILAYLLKLRSNYVN